MIPHQDAAYPSFGPLSWFAGVESLENMGFPEATGPLASRKLVVAADAAVSTTITVSPPSRGAGASVSAIISTPYGQIIVGS